MLNILPSALSPVSNWTFLAPRQTVFGWGARAALGQIVTTMGRRAFVLCGSRTLAASPLYAELLQTVQAAGIELVQIPISSREPLTEDVDAAVHLVQQHHLEPSDMVLGIGGGATLDLAKAVAALAPQAHPAPVVDFLEGVGRGRPLVATPLPWIAIPTTAGTGSEATKNAVISSCKPAFKKSLRSDQMLARVAVIDPELTVSNPPQLTAYSGMDAITQLIEAYLSARATPLTRSLALEGLRDTPTALHTAFERPDHQAARQRMAYAAYLSGLALANGGLGMAHGVAAALGAECGVPHGLACAMLLPAALELNQQVCAAELQAISAVLAPAEPAGAKTVIDVVKRLLTQLKIPRRLSEIGVTARQIPAVVAASRGNSMNGNPRRLDDTELTRTMEKML